MGRISDWTSYQYFLWIIFVSCAFSTATSSKRSILSPVKNIIKKPFTLFRTPKDPEVKMTLEDIVKHWNYPVKGYEIETKDGYRLTAYRIEHGRKENEPVKGPRPVVLFMHGIDASCICFVSNLPENDAAYLYADAGYDVWLGNFRGNVYSQKHKELNADQSKFWNFGWDEMASEDLPAIIDFILKETTSDYLYYVGHSMGSTVAFALLSTDKTYANKIRKLFALGPVTSGMHLKGSAKAALLVVSGVDKLISKLNKNDKQLTITTNSLTKGVLNLFCGHKVAQAVCFQSLFMLEGGQTGQLNKTRLPVFMAHLPAGTSWRTVAHFAQTVRRGVFQKYDFRTEKKNQKHYGRPTPSEYDISLIETPVELYWGHKDYLACPEDVNEIRRKLGKWATSNEFENYNHVDFIWGSKAPKDIYIPMGRKIYNDFCQNDQIYSKFCKDTARKL